MQTDTADPDQTPQHIKKPSNNPKIENELVLLIRMGKSFRHKGSFFANVISICFQGRNQNAEKIYATQRETTGSSSDSLHLRPFLK